VKDLLGAGKQYQGAPYSDEDSKIYGCPPFPQKKFMQEARRVLRRGGYLAILHLYLLPFRKTEWKLVGTICGCDRTVARGSLVLNF
jgi:hypothetical protein